MGLFFADDSYDESRRMLGFGRYKQLLSFYAGRWVKVNLLTVLGGLPLAAGIAAAILTSSILVLIPASLVGGAVFGPFLAALYDSLFRGLRDAPGSWREHYRRSWKQNAKASLLPGAVVGLLVGVYAFMLYMMWVAQTPPTLGTVAVVLFGALLFFAVNLLYWPQLVLFQQSTVVRLYNVALFTLKYFWRVMGAAALLLLWTLLFLLFAPWTLLLVPFLGLWFILFVCELSLYSRLDSAFHIEEQFRALEGDPWRDTDAPSEEK